MKHLALSAFLLAAAIAPARADDLTCLNTTFRVLGADDKVCISVFEDPKVPGVACYIGSLGLAEDPSRFSLTCQQVGPVTTDLKTLKDKESVFSEHTSIFFKHTKVYRVLDTAHNTLVYMAISDKIIEGSPQSALASVAIAPWGK
jgi:CreA protein